MQSPEGSEMLAYITAWLSVKSPALYAIGLGGFTGFVRIIYNGGRWRTATLEGTFCGCITAGAVAGLPVIGLPAEAAGFVGGFVGLVGVEQLRAAAIRLLRSKSQ